MTVGVDATATGSTSAASGATTITNANLTVGSGATLLIVFLNTFTGITGVSVNWNSTGTPQAMTQVAAASNSGAFRQVLIYALLAPTAGSHTCAATWTTGSAASMDLLSFTGTATDTLANACQNAASNTGTGTSATVTATSAIGNLNVCGVCAATSVNSVTATGSTGIFTDNNQIGSGGARATGAASIAWTGAIASSVGWSIAAVDLAAPLPSITRPMRSRVFLTR